MKFIDYIKRIISKILLTYFISITIIINIEISFFTMFYYRNALLPIFRLFQKYYYKQYNLATYIPMNNL